MRSQQVLQVSFHCSSDMPFKSLNLSGCELISPASHLGKGDEISQHSRPWFKNNVQHMVPSECFLGFLTPVWQERSHLHSLICSHVFNSASIYLAPYMSRLCAMNWGHKGSWNSFCLQGVASLVGIIEKHCTNICAIPNCDRWKKDRGCYESTEHI